MQAVAVDVCTLLYHILNVRANKSVVLQQGGMQRLMAHIVRQHQLNDYIKSNIK